MNRIKNGFTLIELIIVVTILGIISAITIPTIFGGMSIPNSMVMNGTICEHPVEGQPGLLFSVSSGYRTQVFGANGLPATCP